jgi:malate/lactate dehydrogenase
MIVTVFGLGYVGSTLASLLVTVDGLAVLNLVDPSETISGRILDLQHAGNWSGVDVRLNDKGLISQSDFIFFAAGYTNSAGKSRYEVAQQNKELIAEVFSDLRLEKNTSIIAFTNPVELAAQWISECLDHRFQVVGTGTLLDSLRLQSLLAEEFEVSTNMVKAMVLGEHGENMVPIFSQALISGQGKVTFSDEMSRERLLKNLRSMATRIRETEAATRYGVAQCGIGILEMLQGKREMIFPVSIRINSHWQKRLRISDDIFMSLPCRGENGKIKIVDDFELSQSELAGMRIAAAFISANS